MKTIKVALLILAFLVCSASPSFAVLRKDISVSKGKVVNINSARTEITIKDADTGRELAFSTASVDSNIMIGSQVVILYKSGTTRATTVRLVVGRKKGAAKTTGKAAPMSEPMEPKTSYY